MGKYIIAIILFTNTLQAQEYRQFAQVGYTWTYSFFSFGFNPGSQEYGYDVYEAKKDTLINDKRVILIKALGASRAYQGNDPLVEGKYSDFGFYQENSRIYKWINNEFYFYFDLSVQIGDTLNIVRTPYYFQEYYYSQHDDEELKIKITNIKNNSEGYKIFEFSLLCNYYPEYPNKFHEKYGFVDCGFRFSECSCYPDAGSISSFRCFESENFYFNVDENVACDSIFTDPDPYVEFGPVGAVWTYNSGKDHFRRILRISGRKRYHEL